MDPKDYTYKNKNIKSKFRRFFIMAYTEPYPVITSWPSNDGYPIGTKRCYHYTLTLDQVAQQRAYVDSQRTSNINNEVFATCFGIGLGLGGAGIVFTTIVSGAMLVSDILNLSKTEAVNRLYEIWSAIYFHMVQNNYKRVTISQLIGVEALYGIDIFPDGYPVWLTIALPRVPDESYYYKV